MMVLFFIKIVYLLIYTKGIICLTEYNYTNYDENYGRTWMYFPDGEGNPQIIELYDEPIGDLRRARPSRQKSIRDKIKFELYTRKFSRTPKVIKHIEQHKRRSEIDDLYHIDPDKLTKILLHGWKSSTKSTYVQDIKNAYLEKFDCNVIAVDWEEIASNFNYFATIGDCREIGRYTAELIDFLHIDRGVKMEKIHMIGHSLGAHAAGYAGSYTSHGRVDRITGLDPAMPGIEDFAGPESRLDQTDANFVDVIHSCGGALGYRKPCGHVDFYPNNGQPIQPGCNGFTEITDACSHGRSHRFFVESILTTVGFYAYRCSSWEDYLAGYCKDGKILMGDATPNTANGRYYLKTNEQSPYAIGLK